METLQRLAVNALVSGISFAGLITIAFALTGRWPPREILLGASIGGLLSPIFWNWVARLRTHRRREQPPEFPPPDLPIH